MINHPKPNAITQIIRGLMILMFCHGIAALLIFVLGYTIGPMVGLYGFAVIWLFGYAGFLFWQLLYVIPLILRFKRRRKFGMMKGVIMGATVTALLNGVCYLVFFVGL
ncbi:MAG: hypothetical protein KTR27_21135 [Leptolyngbyaceae cyanobacterium MAG.088]|nr:hypothetical protein [Leptolyngbyaceae cyanobacterium MAG.088]